MKKLIVKAEVWVTFEIEVPDELVSFEGKNSDERDEADAKLCNIVEEQMGPLMLAAGGLTQYEVGWETTYIEDEDGNPVRTWD